jgi:NAD(P)-dependent dehydrogenase (short-subunit alcohol dehydrogenase family)
VRQGRHSPLRHGPGLALLAASGLTALGLLRRRRATFSLRGRSVVITGGSRGLGLVMAREFAREGARLAILARDGDELERAALDLRGRGADVLPLVADVRRQDDVVSAVRRVEEARGAVDVLVNDAGIIQTGPFEHMTLADFEDSLATHFWGALYAIEAVLPGMRRRGEGRIVNIASVGGRVGVPHLSSYCAGKFALVGLSECLHSELRPAGIAVTTVLPGLMRTGSHLQARFKGRHEAEFAWFASFGSLPVSSMDADRAARRIVAACRRGDSSLVLTLSARLAIALNGVAPGLVGEVLGAVAGLLPGPSGPEGDESRTGAESRSRLPRLVTVLTDAAARRNNEVPVRTD